MEKITKEQFLQDVRDEIEALKNNATQTEKDSLNINYFNPKSPHRCLYGQLTGNCQNDRAVSLIIKGCKRVFDTKKNLANCSIEDGIEELNGVPNKKKHFKRKRAFRPFNKDILERNFQYLSALEGYIQLKGTKRKHRGILEYIKGQRTSLNL